MRALVVLLAFLPSATVDGILSEEDAALRAARAFVTGHRHGRVCLEAYEESESIVGGFDTSQKHSETAEVIADALAEATGELDEEDKEDLGKQIYQRLVVATEVAKPMAIEGTEEGDEAVRAARRKMMSPLDAMELCEFALRQHDEL